MYYLRMNIFLLLTGVIFASGVRIYVLGDKNTGSSRKLNLSLRERSKRQSHSINGRFSNSGPDPLYDSLAPSFFQQPQLTPPPVLNQKPLSLADMVDLTSPVDSDIPIDYLTPPSPTFQNYPSQISNNNNGVFIPTSTPVNTASHQFQNPFSTQQTAFSELNLSVANPGVATFQNGPPNYSNQNSNTQSSSFVTSPSSNVVSPSNSNFGTQSPSSTIPQSREISNFGLFGNNDQQIGSHVQGKWDLGFDASEILNPPIYNALPNTGNDYETLTLNTFPHRATLPPVISSSASSNAPVSVALNPAHSQFTIHGSLRANEHGQSIIWGTFKPSPFNLAPASSNDNLRHSLPSQASVSENSYVPFSDSYLPQGTATDSFIPHSDDPFHPPLQRRQAIDDDEEEEDDDVNEGEHNQKSANQVKGPVYSFVKTFKNGSFKWGVRQGAFTR